jgi:plasmid stabilization system protein ParE
MPTALEIINALAIRAGVPSDDKNLVSLLSSAELSKINVAKELQDAMESGLHSKESATAMLTPIIRKELESTFRAEVYNGVDTELYMAAQDLELGDEDIAELKAEKKTSARIQKIAAKIKALQAKKSDGKGDKAELTNEINKLKAEKSDLLRLKDEELNKTKADHLTELSEIMLEASLAGVSYAQDQLPIEANVQSAKYFLNRALAENDARIEYDKATRSMKLVKKDGTDFYDKNNTRQDFNAFRDKVIADNKLNKVSDPSKGNTLGGTTPPANNQQPAQTGNFQSDVDRLIQEAKGTVSFRS